MDKNNNDKAQDKQIARLLDAQLPQNRIDPWFTRKVLNRLPPKRKKVLRWKNGLSLRPWLACL